MFLVVSCTITGMEANNRKRLGVAVVARRIELGMRTTKALSEKTDLTPRMLGDLENGRRDNFSSGTKAQIERALQWAPGSIDSTLAGGDPTPIPSEVAPSKSFEGARPHPLSDSYTGPGLRPGSLNASLVMSTRERQTLAEVRNKLASNNALTTEESLLLNKFVENEELRTLHVRIDWLPRAEQLEVSELVNDLHMRIEERISESPGMVPAYVEPNPLPREGITPDDLDEEEKEYDDALPGDQTPQSNAQKKVVEVQEVKSADDSQDRAGLAGHLGSNSLEHPPVDGAQDA